MFKFSDARNILKSSLYFLSLCFPVFVRQIARYHPRKNRKTYSEEILKTDPSKI